MTAPKSFTPIILSGLLLSIGVSMLSSCSSTSAAQRTPNPPPAPDTTIGYDDLAAEIDNGQIGDFQNKRIEVRGYVRAYLDLPSGEVLAFGEEVSKNQFPTILCKLSASDTKGHTFRGPKSADGIYESAAPHTPVTVDLLFSGRIPGQDVYAAENCIVK